MYLFMLWRYLISVSSLNHIFRIFTSKLQPAEHWLLGTDVINWGTLSYGSLLAYLENCSMSQVKMCLNVTFLLTGYRSTLPWSAWLSEFSQRRLSSGIARALQVKHAVCWQKYRTQFWDELLSPPWKWQWVLLDKNLVFRFTFLCST